MPIERTVEAERIMNASREEIFEIVSNHVGTPAWVRDVNAVKILKEGQTKNGLGTIREVEFKPKFWSTIQEEITAFEKNGYYTYSIINGMPGLISHQGKWKIETVGQGQCKVTWKVYFRFKQFHWFALLVNNFVKTFNEVQHTALDGLNAKLSK